MRLSEYAPAKVNLCLRIIGRRSDGYHLVESLVAFAEACDVLHAEPADRLSLEVSGPFADALGEGTENLVLRAARAVDPGRGARMVLEKNLPVAAGLGGGSADAAAALRLLPRLWGIRADTAVIAAELGADVPVCLAGCAARVTGVGELVEPLPDWPVPHLLLANPGVRLATPEVFAARRGPYGASRPWPVSPQDLVGDRNDLTPAAVSLCPPVASLLDELGKLDEVLFARMSGSGPTCFAAFGDAEARDRGRRSLAGRGWWVG